MRIIRPNLLSVFQQMLKLLIIGPFIMKLFLLYIFKKGTVAISAQNHQYIYTKCTCILNAILKVLCQMAIVRTNFIFTPFTEIKSQQVTNSFFPFQRNKIWFHFINYSLFFIEKCTSTVHSTALLVAFDQYSTSTSKAVITGVRIITPGWFRLKIIRIRCKFVTTSVRTTSEISYTTSSGQNSTFEKKKRKAGEFNFGLFLLYLQTKICKWKLWSTYGCSFLHIAKHNHLLAAWWYKQAANIGNRAVRIQFWSCSNTTRQCISWDELYVSTLVCINQLCHNFHFYPVHRNKIPTCHQFIFPLSEK